MDWLSRVKTQRNRLRVITRSQLSSVYTFFFVFFFSIIYIKKIILSTYMQIFPVIKEIKRKWGLKKNKGQRNTDIPLIKLTVSHLIKVVFIRKPRYPPNNEQVWAVRPPVTWELRQRRSQTLLLQVTSGSLRYAGTLGHETRLGTQHLDWGVYPMKTRPHAKRKTKLNIEIISIN